jgi:hypothetical protein
MGKAIFPENVNYGGFWKKVRIFFFLDLEIN